MSNNYRYSKQDHATVYRVIAQRRDMRHFLTDSVDPATLKRLLDAAHQAPSVGLCSPGVQTASFAQPIMTLVEEERERTADALGERGETFMRLKVEGICNCGELLVAAFTDGREKHIFGRRTLLEMDLASVACAIQNLGLAARAEGLGMGWVSLFDPEALATLLTMPTGSKPIAILCLGHAAEFYSAPMLIQEGWTKEQPLQELLFHNTWGNVEK